MNKILLTVCLYSEKALPHLRQWENEMFDRIVHKVVDKDCRIYTLEIMPNIFEVIYCTTNNASLKFIEMKLVNFQKTHPFNNLSYYVPNKLLLFGDFGLRQLSKFRVEIISIEKRLFNKKFKEFKDYKK